MAVTTASRQKALYTNSDSRIERGGEDEATEAYSLVRRGDDDEVNKVKSTKANWHHEPRGIDGDFDKLVKRIRDINER
jgi:hypothetical protein